MSGLCRASNDKLVSVSFRLPLDQGTRRQQKADRGQVSAGDGFIKKQDHADTSGWGSGS
jgi:hypothetical protein